MTKQDHSEQLHNAITQHSHLSMKGKEDKERAYQDLLKNDNNNNNNGTASANLLEIHQEMKGVMKAQEI